MSIIYRIDKEQGITFALWHGLVTADEFLAHARKLLSDADWPPHKALHLSDIQTASIDASIDEATLETVANLYGQHPKIAKLTAAVVAGESFEKAVVFQNFIMRYRPSVIVFNTLNTACLWLGIYVDETERTLQSMRAEFRGKTD